LRRVTWLVVLVVAVGFVDGPLLRSDLPLGDDTEIHLYRLVDLDHLLRQGILYSRWQPDLVYGYGSPLFSFYAPLSAYLAEVGHLAGLSLRDGTRLEFALLPLLAGGATLGFLRRRLAPGPALLGAIAYPASLYFVYNLYVRGSISDALALALLPVVLLALDRLVECPRPGRAATLAIAYAALLLSHDITGPMLLPLLVLLALWWANGRRRVLAWSGLGIGLGIGLSLFLLGSAVLGAGDTRVPIWLATPGMHYDHYFVALGALLVPFAVAYPGAMLTGLPIGVGLPQFLLALVALVGLPRFKRRARGEVVIFAASLIACAFLTVPLSDVVWRHLPLLQIINYPWRLLAIAALADALLIGHAADAALARLSWRAAAATLGLAGALLLILAIPYLYPLPGTILPANPSLAEVTAYQQRSGALGSTSDAEFLPRGLAGFPKGPPFPGADEGASLGQKLDPTSVPTGAVVWPLADGQLATRLAVASPSPFVARFQVFRFPGWFATLDGESVALGDPGPFQTLTVPVPAGQHVLAIAFGEPRREQVFDALSVLSAVAVLGLAAAGALGRVRKPTQRAKQLILGSLPGAVDRTAMRSIGAAGPAPRQAWAPRPTELGVPWGRRAAPVLGLLGAALVVAGLKWTVFDHASTPLVRPFDGTSPPGMAVAARHRFGPALDLLGYTLDPVVGEPGQPVTLTLYWETAAPLAVNYSSFAHVLDPAGRTVAQADNVHVADFPTTRWRPGAYARDGHRLDLGASLAPGSYRVEVGVYDRAAGSQLPVDGQATDYLLLPSLTLTAGRRP
jgi:hypothetical protein